MTGATPLGEGGTDTRDVNQHGGPVTINPRKRGGSLPSLHPPAGTALEKGMNNALTTSEYAG